MTSLHTHNTEPKHGPCPALTPGRRGAALHGWFRALGPASVLQLVAI